MVVYRVEFDTFFSILFFRTVFLIHMPWTPHHAKCHHKSVNRSMNNFIVVPGPSISVRISNVKLSIFFNFPEYDMMVVTCNEFIIVHNYHYRSLIASGLFSTEKWFPSFSHKGINQWFLVTEVVNLLSFCMSTLICYIAYTDCRNNIRRYFYYDTEAPAHKEAPLFPILQTFPINVRRVHRYYDQSSFQYKDALFFIKSHIYINKAVSLHRNALQSLSLIYWPK